jgi:hypothetical protein
VNWIPLKADVKLNVSVSTDNGNNWTDIVSKTTQTSSIWNAGSFTGKFWLKFTAPDNLNLSETYGPFSVVNLNKLFLSSPDREIIIAGDTTDISWANTNVSAIKIDFSGNNGTTWEAVSANTATSGKKIRWVVPNTISSNCKIRITDISNAANYDECDSVFRIVKPNNVGGPYLFDKNTMALFHFDNNLNNRSNLSGNVSGNAQQIVTDTGLPGDLGKCVNTSTRLTVANCTALNLTGDWTIEAWVKFTSFGNENLLFRKPGDTDAYQSNYSLEVNPYWGNVVYGYYFSGYNSRIGVISQSPALNEWVHVAFIRDTKTSTISVVLHDKNRNLMSAISSPYSGTATYLNSQDLIIGQGVTGFMDEVRISNVVRSFVISSSGITPKLPFTGLAKGIEVYPQPAASHFTVKLTDEYNQGEYDISIIDLSGRTIWQSRFSGQVTTVERGNLPRGLYILQLISHRTGKQFSTKLSIE